MSSYFLLPKGLYITLYSLYGSAIAYISIYYSEVLHLNSNQIGILLAIAPFVQVVACPLWTVIADKYSRYHGFIMGLIAAVGGSSVISLYFLPQLELDDNMVMMVATLCAFLFAFFGSPICALVDSAVLKLLGDQKLLYGSQRLWGSVSNGLHILFVGLLISQKGIWVPFAVFSVGLMAFVTLSLFISFDQQMITATTNNGSRRINSSDDLNEEERSSLLTGKSTAGGNYLYNPASTSEPTWLQDTRRNSSTTTIHRRDSIANTLYLTHTTSGMAMSVQMEADQELHVTSTMPSLGLVISYIPTLDTSLSALGTIHDGGGDLPEPSILKTILVYTFLLSILLYGLAHSMISQFLFLLLRDLGMEPSLMGWTGPIGGVAEVITFWFSRKLFDTYSVTSLMTAAYLSFMFRALTYMCLQPNESVSIMIALALQVLNGFAYALVWSTAVAEVDSFFPVEQRSVAQGILAALFSGLGYGLGCIIGGFVFAVYGSIKLFQISTFVCALSLVVFLSGRRYAQ
ncbi:major facilitator superfamily domain-containing protein [Parasitella parasitica]|nr:major facilitator superfamily domain-containing protein [Parasitella parasitica]